MRLHAPARILAALLLGAVACSSPPDEALNREDYLAAGNDICRDAALKLSEIDFTSERTESEQEEAAIEYGVLLRDTQQAILALPPPPELEDQHRRVIELYSQFDDAVQAPSEMVEVRERAIAFEDAIAEMGFVDCG